MSMIEMKDSSLPLSRTEMLRALRRYGENIDRCIELCSFDPLLMKNAKMARYLLEDIRSENACYNISSLAVNGKDAINLGFSGIQIGCALELVLEAVITDKLPNRKDALISFLEKMRGDGDVFI